MTIKRNGDRVILKDGKVSCSCCEEPECCMYPAQALADGLYTASDLPDAITDYAPAGSVTYTKLDPPVSELGGIWYYEATISGVVERLGIAINPDQWTYQGAGESGPCLITTFGQQAPGREDQFADTYTVTINPPDDNAGTYTVTRRSICVWSTEVGESGEPAGLKLSYIDAVIGGGFAYTWEIELDTSYIKDGFANTPTGDYAGGNATVS